MPGRAKSPPPEAAASAAEGRSAREGVSGVDEIDQTLPIGCAQLFEPIAARGTLPCVPQDRFFDAAGPAVMQVANIWVDAAQQTQTPQRCRAPLLARGTALRKVVGKLGTHIVQQHV